MTDFENFCKENSIKYDSVEWKTDASTNSCVLFYKFNQKNKSELDLFKKRIADSSFAVCICNIELEQERVFGVSDEEFDVLQSDLLEKLYPINKDLKFIGVTGTNGKTTTVDIIRQLAILRNKKIITFGTLGVYLNEKIILNFHLTTPALIDIYKTLFKYGKGVEVVAFEVSSHAIVQKRFGSIRFDVGVWTSFSQDHLDFHKTMDVYFKAKLAFKNYLVEGKIKISEVEKELIKKIPYEVEIIKNKYLPKNPFFKVEYNKSNLALAISSLEKVFGFFEYDLDLIQPTPGRFNIIPYKDNFIVIDSAHTPDAIRIVCKALVETFKELKLKTILGCGGDRDKTKRAPMAHAASKYSSFLYLTSDNPRFEDEDAIIDDMLPGVKKPYYRNRNRAVTIKKAIAELEGEVLLIAGKGPEEYIDRMGIKENYSDEATVKEVIND